MLRVVVLYEDARSPANLASYGPHELLLWMLFDHTGRPYWELAKVVSGNPRKGKEQVRSACLQDAVFSRAIVVALYDEDHVRDLSGLGGKARRRDVALALKAEAAQPDRLEVVLLTRNLETIVNQVRECAGLPAGDKPTPLERDLLLKRATGDSPSHSRIRDCVLDAIPSVRCLVETIARHLRG